MPTRDRTSLTHRLSFTLRLLLLGVVLADGAWVLADAAKSLWAERAHGALLPWARLFHQPLEVSLLPYIAACVVAVGYGLFLYLRRSLSFVSRVHRSLCGQYGAVLLVVVAAQPIIVTPQTPLGLRLGLPLLSALACLVRLPPARAALPLEGLLGRMPGPRLVGPVCALAAVGVLVGISVEPVKLAVRPAHLLNEYRFLPERPAPGPGAAAPVVAAAAQLGEDAGSCRFPQADPLEYDFQAKTRGPMNHIGHVLNPINEWESGKPIERIYFQYGVGATFVFKWVMDLAGGVSLHAYHWTFLFFVVYWVMFLGAAALLFRDATYVLAAAALLAAGFYKLGFVALVIAPGLNPILHLLDVPVLVATLLYLRTNRAAPLAAAGLGAAGAVMLNGFFGPVLAIALGVAVGLHVLENAASGERLRRLGAAAAMILAPVAAAVLALPRSQADTVTTQFLLGFLSWRPSDPVVLATMAYLVVSYLFLVWWRDRREPLKYAIVFLFVYAQGMLLYFFWSGLPNHFWPVLPYVGLHVLAMARGVGSSPRVASLEKVLLVASLGVAGLLASTGLQPFIAERALYRRVFTVQETHRWPFERARVVSTVDPAPIAASLAQLERWSGPDRRVAILSVFDNLLPFLARRHSVLPHFELQWALLTGADRERARQALVDARVPYLFVGREVEELPPDPWEAPRCGVNTSEERRSQRERIQEIRGLFDTVAKDYERIETGPLLSVYRRVGSGG